MTMSDAMPPGQTEPAGIETEQPVPDVLALLERMQKAQSVCEAGQRLYRSARLQFMSGINGSASTSDFAARVRSRRVMEEVYSLTEAFERIAKHYRDAHHPHGQRMFQFDDTPYAELLRRGWIAFYEAEIIRLARDQPIAIAVLAIEIYAYEPAADAAHELLGALLELQYSQEGATE
jgi:hypothetical protein